MKKKTNDVSALDINAVQSRMTEFENWRSQIVTSNLVESRVASDHPRGGAQEQMRGGLL